MDRCEANWSVLPVDLHASMDPWLKSTLFSSTIFLRQRLNDFVNFMYLGGAISSEKAWLHWPELNWLDEHLGRLYIPGPLASPFSRFIGIRESDLWPNHLFVRSSIVRFADRIGQIESMHRKQRDCNFLFGCGDGLWQIVNYRHHLFTVDLITGQKYIVITSRSRERLT